MKHMFDYSIHAVLSALYDCNDHYLINSVHESYDIVSLLLVFFSVPCCIFFIIYLPVVENLPIKLVTEL